MLKKVKKTVKKLFFGKQEGLKQEKQAAVFFTNEFDAYKNHSIGDYTYGNPLLLFENDAAKLKIGKFCSIAGEVKIFLGGNHRTDWVTTYPFNDIPGHFEEANHITGHPATKGDVEIGNDVWIGYGAMILSGVKIDDGAVIAAGSVVSKNIGPYEIWGGNPAKLIKKRFSDEEIRQLLKSKWWDWPIDEIRKNVGYLCSDEIKNIVKNHQG
ncbi:CatB-related O-acetyltransferase [Flavobacterium amniphilum]|uniref:CatB-related O-acetyltransferase n=1 Tax=Flavobacterium amniphilum TaxID=1834035 RepID=UPI00202A5E6C|nr:CatB-related O-acetyltransferase [Flavobacterium amniphilum]MCL9805118.1 CatB-related O-acetyltransferase [Flavobacterium amniphilum]